MRDGIEVTVGSGDSSCCCLNKTDSRFSAVNSRPANKSVYCSPKNRDKPSGTMRSRTLEVIEVEARETNFKFLEKYPMFSKENTNRMKKYSPLKRMNLCSNSRNSSKSGSTLEVDSKLANKAVFASDLGSRSNPVPGIWTLGPGAGISVVALLINRTVSSSMNLRILWTWERMTASLDRVLAVAALSKRRSCEKIFLGKLSEKWTKTESYIIESHARTDGLDVGGDRLKFISADFSFLGVRTFHTRHGINSRLKMGKYCQNDPSRSDRKRKRPKSLDPKIYKIPEMRKDEKTSRFSGLRLSLNVSSGITAFSKIFTDWDLEILGPGRFHYKYFIMKSHVTQSQRRSMIISEDSLSLMKNQESDLGEKMLKNCKTCKKWNSAGKKNEIETKTHLEQLDMAPSDSNFLYLIISSLDAGKKKNNGKSPNAWSSPKAKQVSHGGQRIGSSQRGMSNRPQRIGMGRSSSTPTAVKAKKNLKKYKTCYLNSFNFINLGIRHELEIINSDIKLDRHNFKKGG